MGKSRGNWRGAWTGQGCDGKVKVKKGIWWEMPSGSSTSVL